jgi:hypothetical protein
MAVLNVKQFPDDLYERLREEAERERRSVAQQVIVLVDRALSPRSQRSLLELRGLGREAWRGRDAAIHVREERAGWD